MKRKIIIMAVSGKRKIKSALQQIKEAGGKKRSKYLAEACHYNGIRYHSKLETRFAAWLDTRMGKICPKCKGSGMSEHPNFYCLKCSGKKRISGDILKWERQVKFDLWADSEFREKTITHAVKVGTYRIDFRVEFADGRVEYLEVKGWDKKHNRPYMRPTDKLKWAIFRANYPELDAKIVTDKELPKGF